MEKKSESKINTVWTFNFRKFKEFKKKLNKELEKKYWKTLKKLFTNSKEREAIYKYIFWFNEKTDLFNNWNSNSIFEYISKDTEYLINEIKLLTKKLL